MSGSLGSWPISPAANPANPAPSLTSPSRFAAGTSFALGRPYRSTNCAKKNSTPRSAAICRTSSSFGSPATTTTSILREVNVVFAEPAQVERVAALAELAADTPEVVLDLDAVRANIDRAAALARSAGVDLRPHTKTHKLPQIARLQLEAGAVGVQVAKLGEAEVMADAGIEDILVGYPLVGDRKLARLAELAGRVSVSVTVDSEEVALGISRLARARGITIRALLELDTGLHRLGVAPGPEAAA